MEFLWHLIYFPIWWYTGGIKYAFIFCLGLVRTANFNLAPGLWLRNIFIPMFGQTDFQGRLMSFFMRFVNVVFRSIAISIWIVIVFLIFLLWPAFPIFIVYMLQLAF